MIRRIYVASSWKNPLQPEIVAALRAAGHHVYDFRNPRPGDHGFHWSEIDPYYRSWTPADYRRALAHPLAQASFESDSAAIDWADLCVLVLPCGRSAHLEAGYCVGAGKPLFILMLENQERELMYKFATAICLDVDDLLVQCDTVAGGDR